MKWLVTLFARDGDVVRVPVEANSKGEARIEALTRSRDYGYPRGWFWPYSCYPTL